MGNFTTVPDVAVNQSFPPSLWESAIMNNLNLGVCRQLADTTVAGSSVANITFASIPATFAHLMMIVYARDTSAGTTHDDLLLQFNANVGSNYDEACGGGSTGQTSMQIGFVDSGAAAANRFLGTLIFIPHYADTNNHKIVMNAISGGWFTTASNISASGVGRWVNTSAITQILIKSSSGNLDIGSRATLYGLPA